jgi:hypothetical protein
MARELVGVTSRATSVEGGYVEEAWEKVFL